MVHSCVMGQWYYSPFRDMKNVAWESIPTVVMWSVWKERSFRILEGSWEVLAGFLIVLDLDCQVVCL